MFNINLHLLCTHPPTPITLMLYAHPPTFNLRMRDPKTLIRPCPTTIPTNIEPTAGVSFPPFLPMLALSTDNDKTPTEQTQQRIAATRRPWK